MPRGLGRLVPAGLGVACADPVRPPAAALAPLARPLHRRDMRPGRRPVLALTLPLSLTAILAGVATPAVAVTPHVVIGDPADVCAIGVGSVGAALPDMGLVTSTPMTTSDGETGFEATCGVADTFFFGAGLSEYFAAHAAATSIVVGKIGVLRGYGYALAESFPEAYGPPFPAEGTNDLSAYAVAGSSAFFVDVITPPPTSAAPNPGDATALVVTPVLDVDCAHFSNAFMQASIITSFWAPAQFTDTSTDFVDPGFIFSTGLQAIGTCPDPFSPSPFMVTGLQVGQPVVMRVNLSVHPFMQLLASQVQFGSFSAEVSALNTATALVTTTDGDPVTGASGHTYVAVDPLPELTVPTTTTTTLPTPTTTTTLPGCGGMCGNGSVDPSCGEACDCPPTNDPIAAAYGCTGGTVVPAQSDCVVCRGCRILSFCVASTVTTTTVATTTIPGATTTTSTVLETTTTTSLPPCAGLAGLDRVRCRLAAALGQPLCGSEVVPPKLDRAVRAKLEAADAALGSAATAPGRRAKKLRRRAVADLRAAGIRAARATRTKNTARHVSASCAATIANLTGTLAQDIRGPRPRVPPVTRTPAGDVRGTATAARRGAAIAPAWDAAAAPRQAPEGREPACERIADNASAIIDPTSETLAGRTSVLAVRASSPNLVTYCSATRSCTAS
jgi:hypothetical protein